MVRPTTDGRVVFVISRKRGRSWALVRQQLGTKGAADRFRDALALEDIDATRPVPIIQRDGDSKALRLVL